PPTMTTGSLGGVWAPTATAGVAVSAPSTMATPASAAVTRFLIVPSLVGVAQHGRGEHHRDQAAPRPSDRAGPPGPGRPLHPRSVLDQGVLKIGAPRAHPRLSYPRALASGGSRNPRTRSAVEERDLELVQEHRIGDQVDGDDPAVDDREVEHRLRPAVRCPHR